MSQTATPAPAAEDQILVEAATVETHAALQEEMKAVEAEAENLVDGKFHLTEDEEKDARANWLPKFATPKTPTTDLFMEVTVGMELLRPFQEAAAAVMDKVRVVDYKQDMLKAAAIAKVMQEAGIDQINPNPREAGIWPFKHLETIAEIFDRIREFFHEHYDVMTTEIRAKQADVTKVIGVHTALQMAMAKHYTNNEDKGILVKKLQWASATWLETIGKDELAKRKQAVENEVTLAAEEGRPADTKYKALLAAWQTYVDNMRTYCMSKVNLYIHVQQTILSTGVSMRNESVLKQKLAILRDEKIEEMIDLMFSVYTSVGQIIATQIIEEAIAELEKLRDEASTYQAAAVNRINAICRESGVDFEGLVKRTQAILEATKFVQDFPIDQVKIQGEQIIRAKALLASMAAA